MKFILNPSGIFHPKVYIFDSPGEDWGCLIGSANFTSGAFGVNSEILVRIDNRDDSAGSVRTVILRQIQTYWNRETARYADQINLERYRYLRNRFRRPLEKAQGRFGTKKAKNLDEIELLDTTWTDFFARVQHDEQELAERIGVLSEARDLFQEHRSLVAMPLDTRQGIAGFAEAGETRWGWFGRMTGAGVFKNLINENPQQLSAALDEIPINGPVHRDDYEAFANQ